MTRIFSALILCILFLTLNCVYPFPLFAADEILFSDNFNDFNLDGWTIERGQWFNDANHGPVLWGHEQGVNKFGEISINGSETWDNFSIEFDVNMQVGVDGGINFRSSPNNGYSYNLSFSSFGFNPNPEVKLHKNVNGSSSVVEQENVNIQNFKFYHVKLEYNLGVIKAWVDNQEVINFEDPNPLPQGKISFIYYTGNLGNINVLYDNLVITKLNSPPPAPAPFLDLPWDYQSQGLSFTEAALAINFYFDHEYPLLSTGLGEPNVPPNTIVYFLGNRDSDLSYSSHDGYDWGKPAKVNYGDPVLAAASGKAIYMNTCGACGNAILIDHGNGYQTRYYHLQKEGLLTNVPGQEVNVTKGQQIGKDGATGNVFPQGEGGAHIHFMVIQDKNNDGNFEDNIPDGLVDPFGWQSKEEDPWEKYQFFYKGENRIGNKSYYLWNSQIDNLISTLDSNQKVFNVGKAKISFPEGTTNETLNLEIDATPATNQSDTLSSIGSGLLITAKNALGVLITTFNKPFTLNFDISQFDLSRYKTDTISFYSSSDGINWQKEATIVDLQQKTAKTSINHLTYFALFAERLDTVAPTTKAILEGEKGTDNWYRSDVKLTLNAEDNQGGLGIDYTLYKLDDSDWTKYESPLNFSNEGTHKVNFYSVDKDENIEEFKTVEFKIDKQIPEAKIYIDTSKKELIIQGIDNNQTSIQTTQEPNKKNNYLYTISDLAGNILVLDVRDLDKKKLDKFSIYSLKYNEKLITLENNNFGLSYKGKGQSLYLSKQSFKIKDNIDLEVVYDPEINKSEIDIKKEGQPRIQETKAGLVLLQLLTNKGKLEYSY